MELPICQWPGATPPPTIDRPLLDPLSQAELRVLAELRRGHSNKGIAAALVLSPRTVESHISNLLAKTGCRNRIQLLLWVLGER
jgi:DNA-binding NarL/FixJ family response regulator